MKTRKTLISRIDKHLAANNISGTRLCHDAKVDHHIIPKLRRGESISLRSIERLEKIIDPKSFVTNSAKLSLKNDFGFPLAKLNEACKGKKPPCGPLAIDGVK